MATSSCLYTPIKAQRTRVLKRFLIRRNYEIPACMFSSKWRQSSLTHQSFLLNKARIQIPSEQFKTETTETKVSAVTGNLKTFLGNCNVVTIKHGRSLAARPASNSNNKQISYSNLHYINRSIGVKINSRHFCSKTQKSLFISNEKNVLIQRTRFKILLTYLKLNICQFIHFVIFR